MGLRGPDGALYPCLRILDPEAGIVSERRLRPSVRPPDGDQASQPWFDGTWIWQPTRTALHRVDPGSLDATEVLTHPLFHDVHSVAPGRHGWLITCTGHEAVVDIARDGHVGQRFSLGPEARDGEHRHLPHDAFKPHAVHPNRAFLHGGEVWVTCLMEACCRSLEGDGVWDIGPGMPHDGVLREGWRWFTTTEGGVRAIDPATGERRVDLDVARLEGAPRAFGWARGIEVIGDRAWVGVTVLRRSALREWASRALRGGREPTRVIELDWRRGRVCRSWEVGEGGEGVIYGVTALPSA